MPCGSLRCGSVRLLTSVRLLFSAPSALLTVRLSAPARCFTLFTVRLLRSSIDRTTIRLTVVSRKWVLLLSLLFVPRKGIVYTAGVKPDIIICVARQLCELFKLLLILQFIWVKRATSVVFAVHSIFPFGIIFSQV